MEHVTKASLDGFVEVLKSNPKQRPESVAEAVVTLLEEPFGEKPFRTVVDFMGLKEPIENYNVALTKTTEGLFASFGVQRMLNLNK
jgi:hypothetical protein